MASLQDIMNVDEDQIDPHTNKKDQLPTSTTTRYHQPYLAPSPTHSTSYAIGGEQPDISSITHSKKSSPISRVINPTTGSPGRPSISRRRSNVSPENMDLSHYGHGYAGPSGGYNPSGPPARPYSNPSPGGDIPVKLTPITGRVSRAKKGMKVHTCDICRPAKTFTRAEHLRRHQLSHETPQYACSVPGCDRAFHRKDLLERHQQRHELEGDKASRSRGPSQSRRTSAGSLEGGVRGFGLHPSILGYPSNATAPNQSLPMTPNMTHSGPYHSISAPDVSRSMSPHMGGDYRPTSGGPAYGGGYTLSAHSPQPLLHQAPINGFNATPAFTADDYSQPRTTPDFSPLFLQTNGLGLVMPGSDALPELTQTQDNAGWPSSASDSSYSTPSDNSRRGALWSSARANTEWQGNLLSAYREAPLETLPANIFYQYSPSPQLPVLDVSMAGYADEQTLYDPHQQPRFANTVRSPTPPVASASAQSCETLVTPSTALPSDRMMNSLACMGRQKEVALGLLAAPALMQGSLPQPPANVYRAIPSYLEVYWEKVHQIFPIVHRRTFEAAVEQFDVLRCAMAAVATQYMSSKEDRIRGNQLHEYAWQQSRRFLQWDVPVMQAILLCEFFARFRGRRAAIRPSKEFESIYSRVSDSSVVFGTVPMTGTNTVRWHTWLDMETRRRLLAACFVLDNHSSVYLEQQRVRDFDVAANGVPSIPLIGPMNDLWEAPSADTWAAVIISKGSTLGEQAVLSMTEFDTLSSANIDACVPFDRSIILAFETLLLPVREDSTKIPTSTGTEPSEPETLRMARLFPEDPVASTYLALHHTPLHDLLAVSGDSWIFSQNVLQPKTFAEHQKRLGKWCDSSDAALAVVFACRALRAFTEHGNVEDDSDDEDEMDAWEMGRPRMWKDDITDYWGMYVCALICWAYGHRANRTKAGNSIGDESAAMRWMRKVASMRAADVLKLRTKENAMDVVGLVRRWLEIDCIGGRSRLYVDAVGVLKKLEQVVNWRSV
ncbi:Zinc finger protein klf1 [Colletotrichum sidae]|uniref:Zinc finger protein klf1 n=1 Tax=Colletotrichum sidae TaxID=1347389 RepID=A0A4R8TVM1_9PEZI|nr:Zinc finger protein klf1 [Colletotrichum sidae]